MASYKMYTLKCVDPDGRDAWFRFDSESTTVWTNDRREARLFHASGLACVLLRFVLCVVESYCGCCVTWRVPCRNPQCLTKRRVWLGQEAVA